MTREEIRDYVHRDWAAIEAAKVADWGARKRQMTAGQALAVASGLRQSVKRLRPDWPSPANRAEDLAAHVELARRLRLVQSRSGR